MDGASADALVAGVGLRNLVVEHSTVVADSARVFRVRGTAVELPGGEPGEALWNSLAGTSPHDARRFLRALFAKDGGRLAAFYAAVAKCDDPHKNFYAASSATPRLYALFRDRNWPADVLKEPAGMTRRQSLLTSPGRVEAILAQAELDRFRAAPLDEESRQILSRHMDEWKSLLAYFKRLPALGGSEFRALEAFAAALPDYQAERRNQALGMWHALVELTALGMKAGSLDAKASAQAFARVRDSYNANSPPTHWRRLSSDGGGRRGSTRRFAARLLRLGGEGGPPSTLCALQRSLFGFGPRHRTRMALRAEGRFTRIPGTRWMLVSADPVVPENMFWS
jgi:hypothetical protein